jgi:hypothetical protein
LDERQSQMEHRPIREVKEQLVYRNRFVELYDDDVEFRDGSPGKYIRLVESNGRPGVAALAICDNQIGLVETFRYLQTTGNGGSLAALRAIRTPRPPCAAS